MSEGSTATHMLGRGAVAGVAGTVVMTAFQKFVEMRDQLRGETLPGCLVDDHRLGTPTHLRAAGAPRADRRQVVDDERHPHRPCT